MNKDDWHSQTSFTLTPFNAVSAMSFSRERLLTAGRYSFGHERAAG